MSKVRKLSHMNILNNGRKSLMGTLIRTRKEPANMISKRLREEF